jgi:hypothetical protein
MLFLTPFWCPCNFLNIFPFLRSVLSLSLYLNFPHFLAYQSIFIIPPDESIIIVPPDRSDLHISLSLSLSLLIFSLIIIIVFFVNKNYDIIPFLSQSLTPLQDRGKTFICERVIARALYTYIWPRPVPRNRPGCYRTARGKYRSSGKPNICHHSYDVILFSFSLSLTPIVHFVPSLSVCCCIWPTFHYLLDCVFVKWRKWATFPYKYARFS